MAAAHGCHVTAITVSPAQFAHATAGRPTPQERLPGDPVPAGQVDIRLLDYRDVTGIFDRIVSVEMIEAVGERYWPTFFGQLRDRLAPGGVAVLQAITIDERLFASYRRSADFIQRHVFPGGMLPSRAVLRRETARAGLVQEADIGYGQHYAQTLALWKARFHAARPVIAASGFDDRFRRLWDMYLDYCRAGFQAGTIDLRQIRLARA